MCTFAKKLRETAYRVAITAGVRRVLDGLLAILWNPTVFGVALLASAVAALARAAARRTIPPVVRDAFVLALGLLLVLVALVLHAPTLGDAALGTAVALVLHRNHGLRHARR